MLLPSVNENRFLHLNSIAHEGKVVVFGTTILAGQNDTGQIWYTVRQDGFEDSYLNKPAEDRTGWEDWRVLQFPNEEADDPSVVERETNELTDNNKEKGNFIFRSVYRSKDRTAIAPVQLVSALGHIYVFRQSKENTLLVDRFVLDGLTNELVSKLDVRFKRSRQKYVPYQKTDNKKKGGRTTLTQVDTLDFRDADGNPFYEPTTELCLIKNVVNGWFSVVLVPTNEHEHHRWHIFAYNNDSDPKRIEMISMRSSDEGLFDVRDGAAPLGTSGIIRRTLELTDEKGTPLKPENGLAATKYDVQKEVMVKGESQFVKEATRILLAIPTNDGNTAALSFGLAGDGTLAQIEENGDHYIWRADEREILLPLNTLDEIKAIGDSTSVPQGIISKLGSGDDDRVVISSDQVKDLKWNNTVEIKETTDYNGHYMVDEVVDKDTFTVITKPEGISSLGSWKLVEEETSGLVFNGLITAYEGVDGRLRVTCKNHGLGSDDEVEVQIVGTTGYNAVYRVIAVSDNDFMIDRKWQPGEAVNIIKKAKKRRGIQFDGVADYIEIPDAPELSLDFFTIEAWVNPNDSQAGDSAILCKSDNYKLYLTPELMIGIDCYWPDGSGVDWTSLAPLQPGIWSHISVTFDEKHMLSIYVDGKLDRSDDPINYGAWATNTESLLIGKRHSGGCFGGKIADVRIWNQARTEKEIKDSMYLQLTGMETGLVGYWRLGAIAEGTERKVVDFSVSGFDGVVHGNAFVSEVSLERKLGINGLNAIQYSNEELFAVSQGAAYVESFEFRLTGSAENPTPPLFKFSYWGKKNRNAEKRIPEDPAQGNLFSIEQEAFGEPINGWYTASCRFTVPDEVSLVRLFEISLPDNDPDHPGDDWDSIEIRKHRIRLVSNSITEAKYSDQVALALLGGDQAKLRVTLNALEAADSRVAVLWVEKKRLEDKLAFLNRSDVTTLLRSSIQELKDKIGKKNDEITGLKRSYEYWGNEEVLELAEVVLYSDSEYQKPTKRLGLGKHNYGGNAVISFSSIKIPNGLSVDVYRYWKQNNAWYEKATYPDATVSITSTQKWTPGFGHVFTITKNNLTSRQYTLPFIRVKKSEAYNSWVLRYNELNQLVVDLAVKEEEAANTDKSRKDAQVLLDAVIAELAPLVAKLAELNKDFLTGVAPQAALPMEELNMVKGLTTQGALLGFVRPASRLNAMETCEGNVQLSYFDPQGQMRQTNYDATADIKGTFEQWLPNALRSCLNFNKSSSVVKLENPLILKDDWTIEAWFSYPLPVAGEWNTLTAGKSGGHHIRVRNRKQLGIYLENDPLGQNFYESGFDMETLSPGWHHLTAVGKGDTTLFYIDGDPEKVANTKETALADARKNLENPPNDLTAKKKVEDLKKATLKVVSDVYAIGNNHLAFDKPAENAVMQFDGVNDYVEVPYSSAMNPGTFTVSLWAKVSGGTSHRSSLTSRDENLFRGYALNVGDINKWRFSVGDGTSWNAILGPDITIDRWTHITGTFDGNMLKLYIDGTIRALRCGYSPNTARPLRIGAAYTQGHPQYFFNGQIADVRIWNVARTERDIQADMKKRLSGQEPNLVAYYPMHEIKTEGTTGKIINLVDNNHGTVIEAKVVNDPTLSLAPFIRGEHFGKLAEVRIWGVALSEEEVVVNSKTLLTGNEPDLLAYYPMNETKELKIVDQTGKTQCAVENASPWGCGAPIGNLGHTVMQFDGVNDFVQLAENQGLSFGTSTDFTIELWVKTGSTSKDANHDPCLVSNKDWRSGTNKGFVLAIQGEKCIFNIGDGTNRKDVYVGATEEATWHHMAVTVDRDGDIVGYQDGYQYGNPAHRQVSASGIGDIDSGFGLKIGQDGKGTYRKWFHGQMAEIRLWKKVRSVTEINESMNRRLTGQEPDLIGYWPLNEINLKGEIVDLSGTQHGSVIEARLVLENTLPIVGDAVASAEYSTYGQDPETGQRSSMMRKFLAAPTSRGILVLPEKRIEMLDLKWIGNGQFAPTLLGYIEGAPPAPSENLTEEDDYNGATSVELSISDDVTLSWNRAQDVGWGESAELFAGADEEAEAGLGVLKKIFSSRAGVKGNAEFSFQQQHESNITAGSSINKTDRLELRGTPETDPKFPHLGNRFIPKNVGYALVVSALVDVFITRLRKTRRMVSQLVLPVENIPPDVNTITFLINPSYTMSGSLDGMTGSSATSNRFFKHVPEMRAQYGALYPASYYRLQEAYDLKQQITLQDKKRESYFAQFNAAVMGQYGGSVDDEIYRGDAPQDVSVTREEDKPATPLTAEEQKKADAAAGEKSKAEVGASSAKQKEALKEKRAEIDTLIADQGKKQHAMGSLENWQTKMQDIIIRAGKRNLVNTYVWDADGGLRTEAQSFANTVEHTIGGAFTNNAGLGGEGNFVLMGVAVELTAQATTNLTQTMSKTESRSTGIGLNVDVSGVESKGITDHNDYPLLPGEKVDRYRFMSFYLESSTKNFNDFFNYVVDPEWLASNDEEARALRQAQGKANKTWRILHRVTYVERPALMGFGRDIRSLTKEEEMPDNKQLQSQIVELKNKIDEILNLLDRG